MAQPTLKDQLFKRDVDASVAADYIMGVLRTRFMATSYYRCDLLFAHREVCYHYAHRENARFELYFNNPRVSPFQDHAELIAHFCGGTPLLNRQQTPAQQLQAAE